MGVSHCSSFRSTFTGSIRKDWLLVLLCLGSQISKGQTTLFSDKNSVVGLTEKGASFLSSLPMRCWEKEFPYKTGIVFLDSSMVAAPKNYHPAFYGCYDWHSSVHGHWMLVKLLKEFPHLAEADAIRKKLAEHLTAIISKKNF